MAMLGWRQLPIHPPQPFRQHNCCIAAATHNTKKPHHTQPTHNKQSLVRTSVIPSLLCHRNQGWGCTPLAGCWQHTPARRDLRWHINCCGASAAAKALEYQAAQLLSWQTRPAHHTRTASQRQSPRQHAGLQPTLQIWLPPLECRGASAYTAAAHCPPKDSVEPNTNTNTALSAMHTTIQTSTKGDYRTDHSTQRASHHDTQHIARWFGAHLSCPQPKGCPALSRKPCSTAPAQRGTHTHTRVRVSCSAGCNATAAQAAAGSKPSRWSHSCMVSAPFRQCQAANKTSPKHRHTHVTAGTAQHTSPKSLQQVAVGALGCTKP